MKKSKYCFFGIVLIIIALFLIIYPVYATDITPPEIDIESLTVDKTRATIGDKIKISLR